MRRCRLSQGAEPIVLWANFRRVAHLGAVLGRHALVHGIGGRLRRQPWLRRRLAPPLTPPQRFRALLEALGGTFIKFGQVLALQPDLIPREYCDELFDLMDKVPPFDFTDVKQIFREDLGRTPAEIFDSFEERPMASASIGQVHRAHLNGRKLAVKVQRPNAMADFGGDIRIMKTLVYLIERLNIERLHWLLLPMGGFIRWTGEELDYRVEARYMRRLARNARDSSSERVPDMLPELCTRRILTAEYLEGHTLLEYFRALETGEQATLESLRQVGFDPDKFAESVLENFLSDVFRHGVFHADLHPANLLILPDNVVGYVDFGITGVISKYSRRHLMAAILALIRADTDELFHQMMKICEIADDSDVEGFRNGFKELAEVWYRRQEGETTLRRSYTLVLLDTIRLSRDTKVLPHHESLRYMRSVITVDGLISRFAPGVELNELLERFCTRLLEFQALTASLSTGRVIEWWAASSRLLRDGALRLDRYLERLETLTDPRALRSRKKSDRANGTEVGVQALSLSAVVLTLVLLMVLLREPVELGLNLFTAELLLIGAGLLLFARKITRWLSLLP